MNCSHVSIPIARIRKGFVAESTRVRFLAAMNKLVLIHVGP